MVPGEARADELAAIVREIRERVRQRHIEGQPPGLSVPLPDLLPILHARDAAEGKAAAIGTVNPRPPGLIHDSIQRLKRVMARGLGWFVRDQVDFNRAVVDAITEILEALNATNRVLADVGAERDMRRHWMRWREEWESRLAKNEVQFLRTIADLQAGYQYRASLMEANFREMMRSQHTEFMAAMQKAVMEAQQKLWEDLERIRLEYERLIHSELRLLRQKLAEAGGGVREEAKAGAEVSRQPPIRAELDYGALEERFRGSSEEVRERQRRYVPYFLGRQRVLDIGCGRGEFLELLQEAGVAAEGVDLDEAQVRWCRQRGLKVEQADLFDYLEAQPEAAYDGIFAAHVVEHLAAHDVPRMVKLAASRLSRGGLLAVETPNPQSLAIFATYFYLDPTHQRPLPAELLRFYFEEYGLGGVEVLPLSPAEEHFPALRSLPEDVRRQFFGALDYAILGRRL